MALADLQLVKAQELYMFLAQKEMQTDLSKGEALLKAKMVHLLGQHARSMELQVDTIINALQNSNDDTSSVSGHEEDRQNSPESNIQ